MSETIIEKNLGDAIAPRYKMYALETLAERAIPDIRDGLKPVHLRILYCMYNDLNLTHSHKTIKSAKVSGAVMGSYHPHGDSYPTMVGLAQPWNMRYPIVRCLILSLSSRILRLIRAVFIISVSTNPSCEPCITLSLSGSAVVLAG